MLTFSYNCIFIFEKRIVPVNKYEVMKVQIQKKNMNNNICRD
jgi:hypothetical protein